MNPVEDLGLYISRDFLYRVFLFLPASFLLAAHLVLPLYLLGPVRTFDILTDFFRSIVYKIPHYHILPDLGILRMVHHAGLLALQAV